MKFKTFLGIAAVGVIAATVSINAQAASNKLMQQQVVVEPAVSALAAKNKTPPKTFGAANRIKSNVPGSPVHPASAVVSSGTPLINCYTGFSKTGQTGFAGNITSYTCTTQTIECTDKSKVVNSMGIPAQSMTINLEKIAIGVGDASMNKFKIEYKCAYMWPAG